MKKLLFIFLLVVLSSCVQQSKYEMALETIDSLKMANELLLKQNDELLNGENRLIINIESYNRERKYLKAYDTYNTLKTNYPESQYIINNRNLLLNIESKAFMIMDSIDKARRDSIKLANINELGIWNVGNYVNDFNEPTGNKYVYADVYGNFSNTATSGSRLRVRLLIDKPSYLKNISYSWSFDEYNDGIEEERNIYSSVYTKIVNRATKKVYIRREYGDFYDENDNKCGWCIEELIQEDGEGEGLYEVSIYFKDKTEYRFSINTNYLNNALIKAGFKDFE